GYTFVGWNTEADGSGDTYREGDTFTQGAGAMTLYAQWSVNHYELRYEGNGEESGSAPEPEEIVYGSEVEIADSHTLSRTGYTFVGWNTEADGSGDTYREGDTFTQGAGAMTLYAQWSVNHYELRYEGNGEESGSPPKPESFSYGSEVEVADSHTLSRTGYTFVGWNTEADGSGDTYREGDTFTQGTEAMTLYAQWLINHYELRYEGNAEDSGSPPESESFSYGSEVEVADSHTLSRTGYTFVGWNTEADGSGDTYREGDTFTQGAGAMTLYAKWSVNHYELRYEGNGEESGSAPEPEEIVYGSEVEIADSHTLSRTGYTFVSWNTEADGSGEAYNEGDTFTQGAGDMTLYAKWSVNDYELRYDGNGHDEGSAPEPEEIVYGSEVEVADSHTLSRTGYTFVGWNTEADGSGETYREGDTFTQGEGNVTLYAKWSVNHYELRYEGNGEESGSPPKPESFSYGSEVVVADSHTLSRTGYTFVGWNTEADGSGTTFNPGDTFRMEVESITLHAQWGSNNALLSELVISNGILSPVFEAERTHYTVEVGHHVASITFTPSLQDERSTVTINGNEIVSGQASSPISLDERMNKLLIEITSEDGSTMAYTVDVLRRVPTDTAQLTRINDYVTMDDEPIRMLDDGGILIVTLEDELDDVTEVRFTQKQVQQLQEKGVFVQVVKEDVSLQIPFARFDPDKGLDLTLQRQGQKLTELVYADRATSSIYQFNIFQDGESISVFDHEIELSFLVNSDGMNRDELQVYYFNPNTQEWEWIGGIYSNGSIQANTSHFSTFAVFHPSDFEEVISEDEPKESVSEGKPEHEEVIEDQKLEENDEGESLPMTATQSYNKMMMGVMLLIAGMIMFLSYRRHSMKGMRK
ncbi:InlB B-repeat-containing protein, partial [Halalkalibacter sp. APA_J-10(15)]|uniref:InlB B-repeat-containing protein n=1 Tax=Halalkalibacter sp. APA_J-10(15) TaxID=2933805 RepID=UPI001FF55BA7